jgi:uracil-DNA glycosylase
MSISGAGATRSRLVEELAAARIGATFNQYADSPLRCARLAEYLDARRHAPLLLVGEAAGYRGARVSGIPFTSESQLTGTGPAEATASVVHRVLAELGLEEEVMLWNLVPTHPHRPGNPCSNRAPTGSEIRAGAPFLETLAAGRRVVPVGRLAQRALGGTYVRHPGHGGGAGFRRALLHFCAGGQESAIPLF